MLDNPKLTIMQFRSTLKDQIHSFIQSESRSVMSDCLQPHGLYSPWNSPGQNTGTGSLSLLQGIFPTHGLNPSLLYGRQILYQLNHKGSPRILEWVAYFFSSGSPQPRNRTSFSCIAGKFFTNWAIREAQNGKETTLNARDLGSILGLGRSPGEGNGNPFLYFCLESSIDRGAWWPTVYGVAKNQAWLSDFHFLFTSFNWINTHKES